MEGKIQITDIRSKGKEIATSLKNVKTIAEFEGIQPEIEHFIDTVDELFGVTDEDFESETKDGNIEKSSDLSLYLSIACNWKRDELEGKFQASDLATEYINQFEDYLQSDDWIK